MASTTTGRPEESGKYLGTPIDHVCSWWQFVGKIKNLVSYSNLCRLHE
jgi:hypothetical protein